MCRPVDGNPDEDIANRDAPAVDEHFVLDNADDETGEVVLAIGIEARHLRGFAAKERATVVLATTGESLDDLSRDVGLQRPGREVVEKEQWPGPLDEDVVDAVVDQVDANRLVRIGEKRDFQLGADAVGAGHENRCLGPERIEPEQPAERADFREHAWRERRLRQCLDAADGLVAGVDVNA